ncbi:S46 family peptidase [Hymenobacter sp. BT186]|uniref:Dipeptidyl-peptidase n=1 Tax=Hymenobacter telluris TaxID=2816474 RepID=A0A939EWI4_9BACT|nr:S46 family peptidase [Hymenobacter telluris]MBO0357920.1 S46 family peptidase [Hymenobacter telluris]MBW3373947.1 S46 family peptidase [Hymenobacter norwichensis]
MHTLSRLALLVLAFLTLTPQARADEGMWLPLLLKQLNEADMQKKGLKLTAEQIYSVNQGSLKDAVVQFGGGCTGEIISAEGLLLTNHHCGYSQIQQHSSVENDYLTKGYWAMNREQELPNPGLTATFIVRMEDVTSQVLMGVPKTNVQEVDREKLVQTNIQRVAQAAVQGTHYQAFIRPFYNGNEYYMFVTEVFQDIRLVGAPPSSIGKFGGDTDNWAWPRHTGDFSIFRIYAGPDNKPAAYSKDNVPFKPRHHLPISLAGVQPGDFTLVFGFPGRTNEYLTSWGVEETYSVSNPAKIKVRDAKLKVLNTDMAASDKVRIQYAAKYASIANYWKKWIGENRGLKKLDAVTRKQQQETVFQQWANSGDEARKAAYGTLLPQLQRSYTAARDYTLARDYVTEAALGIELIAVTNSLLPLAEMVENKVPAAELATAVEKAKKGTANFFRNYSAPTDRKVAVALLPLYATGTPTALLPAYVKALPKQFPGAAGWATYVNQLYSTSRLTSNESAQALLDEVANGNARALLDDPAAKLASAITSNYRTAILPTYTAATDNIALLQRTYVAGLRQQQPERTFYPDANSTLRVAYGQVQPYQPADGTQYEFYTTLDGIMEKADPTNPEFEVPARLAELYQTKDYGPYAYKGSVPVAFIATNHTTGGNSGSPVINGRGELIGTNFDRNWEGTMSDIMFDPDRVRNITLDVRYMLFVVDKFAGAKHLVNEMTLVDNPNDVKPESGKKVKKVKVKKANAKTAA